MCLSNVYYVPDARKNLVFRSLFNKYGFKLVLESDKFVFSKGGIFVEKATVSRDVQV